MAPKKVATPLARKAVLVSVSVSQWTARKLDKKVTDEVNRKHHASDDAGRYNKLLIDPKRLTKINTIVSQARALHYSMTRPWADEGMRILPNALYADFTEKFRKLKREFEAAADEFAAGYEAAVAERKRALNGLFNAKDYPSAREIRSKFNLDHNIIQFPDAADFRSDLDEDVLDDIRADLAAKNERVIDDAMRETAHDIIEKVGHMAEKLKEYQGVGARKGKGRAGRTFFFDSLVDNVRELADLLPAFNLTNDPKLTEITARIRQELCAEDAKKLREDDKTRKSVQKSADAIVKAMEGLY
jgi:hypothetical protein